MTRKFRGYSILQPGTNLCDTTVLIVIFFPGNCSPIHSGMAAAIFSLHWKGSVKKVLLCCSWKQFVVLGFLYEPKSTGTSLPSTPLFSYLIGALNPQTVCVLSK